MKKVLCLFLILVLFAGSANSGKRDEPGDFRSSITNLRHEADSLNSNVKKYNEKN